MKKTFPLNREENCVCLSTRVVYGQKQYWCNATTRQLTMSFMCPRRYFGYDTKEKQPLIVFICGGGFEKEDVNVWTPELAYFAKNGYSVACVDYSVLPFTQWPEQIEDVKLAIRYLRAHAEQFCIDPDRIAVMGESAGGYLAAMVGTTGETREFDVGDYLDQSSAVQCVLPWYPAINPGEMAKGGMYDPSTGKVVASSSVLERSSVMPDAAAYITKNTPPFCMVHGTGDEQVDISQSEYMYEKLEQAGVEANLLIVEDAGHADAAIVNSAVKAEMLQFLDRHLKQ